MPDVLLWVVFGCVVGWVASIMVSTDPRRIELGNIIIGILGAVIGGTVALRLGAQSATGVNIASLIIAVISSILFIIIALTLHSYLQRIQK